MRLTDAMGARSQASETRREEWYERRQRDMALKKATEWTNEQAKRLGVSPDEITAAVTRGWIAQDIEALPAAEAERLVGPPWSAELDETLARIKAAPIRPLPYLTPSERRRHEMHTGGQRFGRDTRRRYS